MLNEETSGMSQEASQEMFGGQQQGGLKQATPQQDKAIEGYSSALINVVYDKQTSPAILKMLEGAPPEQSIPTAVLQINKMVEGKAKEAGRKIDLNVLLNSAILLTKELMEVGEAGGIFKIQEEEVQPILQKTMQGYIVEAVKEGQIDPVELQATVEPMMNEQQKQMGMQAGAATGVPVKAGVGAAMDKYASDAVRKERSRIAEVGAGKAPQGGK